MDNFEFDDSARDDLVSGYFQIKIPESARLFQAGVLILGFSRTPTLYFKTQREPGL